MATVEANESTDPSTEQSSLTLRNVNGSDLLFFEYLRDKNDIDIHYSYDAEDRTLCINVRSDDFDKNVHVKQVRSYLDSPCKQIYQLHEQENKLADEFINAWESSKENSSVFMFRSKRQFSIMALKDHFNEFTDNKRKFEVKVLKLSYYTFEKIEVSILNENLDNLVEVDAIVNPTNKRLEQKGRVSEFLSKKGGEVYVEECRKLKAGRSETYIPNECFVTSWGNCQRTKIIHVVCPSIDKEKSQDVQTIIYETIYSCLKTAEKEQLETVAIPFVYTGRGKVTVDKCAIPYVQAVLQFSMDRLSTFSVDRIYFIDQDLEKTEAMTTFFDDFLPKNVYQQFEIPTSDNAEIRTTVQQESDDINTSPKSSERKETCLPSVPTINQLSIESYDDGEYETINDQPDNKPSNEPASSIQKSDFAISDTVDKTIEREIDDEYEDMIYVDDVDECDAVANFGIADKLHKSETDDCYNTIDEKTETKNETNNTLMAENTTCKEQVETLRSGVKIIYQDVETKQQTITQSDRYQSKRRFSNTNPEIKTVEVFTATVQDSKYSTSSSRLVVNDKTETIVERKNDQYENLLHSRNSTEYENDVIRRDTVDDTVKRDTKTVGNILIIDETKRDEVCIKNGDVMQNTNADKVIPDYVNVQQQQQHQVEDGIDTCDYGSANAKNESENDSQEDTQSAVIEKHSNSGEENVDTDEKERQVDDKNQSLIALPSEKEIDGENVGEKGNNGCAILVDKTYCNINVETHEDHDYYNIENDSKSEVLPSHKSEQSSRSHDSEDWKCHTLEDNYAEQFGERHKVHIFRGDIRKAETGVIICPEISNTRYGGIIAVSIKCAFRNVVAVEIPRKVIKYKGKRIATTNCRLKGSADELEDRVRFIYHLLTPIYKSTVDEKDIAQCVDLIFKKVKKHRRRQVKRIYIPLLGIEDVSNEDSVKTCCQILVKAIHRNLIDGKYLRDPVEVMLVNRCKQITDMLIKEMKIIAK